MKKKFEQWAISQPDFQMYNGQLRWFKFDFWELEPLCQKRIILKFRAEHENA